MTDVLNRCARGPRCHAYEYAAPDPDGHRNRLGQPCDRPLCDVCENAARTVLDDAPILYVQLRNATLIRGQAEQAEQVSISRGSPMPVNAAALHLGEQLANLLADGEDEVRRVAQLTRRRSDGRREGHRVDHSARMLTRWLSAWIAADTTGVCALLDWRTAVRSLPGLDMQAPKAVRRYQQRCPGCGVRAITHRAGDDLMHCQNCGGTQEYLPTLPDEADYRQDGAA